MPTIPDVVDRDELERVLADLGIDTTDLLALAATATGIELTYIASEPDGKRIVVGGEVAHVTYAVRVANKEPTEA